MKNCKNCPMFWETCDCYGEWDEECGLGIDMCVGSFYCKLPRFIKKIHFKIIAKRIKKY